MVIIGATVVKPPSIMNLSNGSVCLECIVEGQPQPDVVWEHNGQLVISDDRRVVKMKKTCGRFACSLTIKVRPPLTCAPHPCAVRVTLTLYGPAVLSFSTSWIVPEVELSRLCSIYGLPASPIYREESNYYVVQQRGVPACQL
ncbi:unnamed protein product [Sphagnum balticum]